MVKAVKTEVPTGRREVLVPQEDAYPEYPERPYEEAKKK